MSYNSSKSRAIYGTSTVVGSKSQSSTKSSPSFRRDSTAPLMNSLPVSSNEDPLHNTSFSSPHHHRSTLRRRKNESESEESEEETTRELNTSDEESESSEEEEEAEEAEENDTIYHLIQHQNEVRIRGLNDFPSETRVEQDLLLVDEDVHIRIIGYQFNRWKLFLYQVSSVLSLGIVWLICRWVPKWYVAWVGKPVPLKKAEWLVFEVNPLSPLISRNEMNSRDIESI